MNKRQTSHYAALLLTIALVGALPGFTSALESDKNQEMQWSADGDSRMSIDNGIRIYRMVENVRITQGSLEIRGDAATIEYDIGSNQLSKVTVTGSPAHYQQQLDSSDEPVQGTSNTLTFYTDEMDGTTVIELIGDAVIESPTSNLRCSSIVYVADLDLIREAPGPCSGVFNSSDR